MTGSPADRTPTLEQLLRRQDLERTLEPFLAWGLDGIRLFDVDGMPFAGVHSPDCPLASWELLPPEAGAAGRGGSGSFGLDDHEFEVRAAYAGADRVGVIVYSARADRSDSVKDLAETANAMSGVIGSLLQAGFATWVTSELHLAASESSFAALQQQNAELQRAVDHLRELDQLKSNFLATVSHELRTPLTSVIGFSEMLLKGIAGDLNPEQREYVQTIFERGEELFKLITQILEMSRMETGGVHLALAPCHLSDIASRAMSSVQIPAQRAEVRVVSHLTHEMPPVAVDPDKIQQVFVNLFSNAVKFSAAGGEVSVNAVPAPIRRPFEGEDFFGEETTDALRVSVSDRGIGIPPEQLERIFDAFYQVDASSTREHGGAGLGLSIVKKLVEAHGGEIWAESTVGVGTTFHFTVPLAGEGAAQVSEDDDGSRGDQDDPEISS
jgi:signal transduction histidine kinase